MHSGSTLEMRSYSKKKKAQTSHRKAPIWPGDRPGILLWDASANHYITVLPSTAFILSKKKIQIKNASAENSATIIHLKDPAERVGWYANDTLTNAHMNTYTDMSVY